MMKMYRNVPLLRFEDFRIEWEMKSLGELSVNGFSNGVFNDPKKVGKGYRIINVKDMYTSAPINIGNLNRVAIDQIEFSKNKVEYGDIFFTRSSLVKEGIAYSNVNLDNADDLTFDGHLIRMRPNKDKYSPIFLYYCFATRQARQQFIKRGKTTTMTTIGQEDISKVEIVVPSLPEQQKIASFLTSVDTKIQQLTQKKALLEQYKKGVMQKIFKQEIRFKDERERDYPEWEKMSLGDLLSFKSTKSYSRSQLNYESGAYRYIHYGDIHTKYRSMFDVTKEDVPFVNTDVLLGMVADENICKPGDLVIADASEDHKDLGKTIEIIETGNQSIIAGLHTFLARDENGLTVVGFKGYLMQVHKVRNQIMTKGTGISVLGISKSNLAKVRISLPSKAEQRKIVDFLTAIDKNIYAIGQQVELTKQFKKGLLQQMFV